MAGFRGPLFLLSLSAQSAQAGFRNPLPIPPVSGTSDAVQAGFRNPLPIPPLGGTDDVVQAGFIGPLPILNLGGRTPDDRPTGGGPSDGAVRDPLQDDEEVIILVAQAFLTMVSQCP